MEPRLNALLKTTSVFIIIIIVLSSAFTSSAGSFENDRDFKFCGTWRHGGGALHLTYKLSPGCGGFLISANESALSVEGNITARCARSAVIDLPGGSAEKHFCVFWDPLLDKLWMEVEGENHSLCEPAGLQGSCCTDLSRDGEEPRSAYGIADASVKGDGITDKTVAVYSFFGESINCEKKFCDKAGEGPARINMIEEAVMRSHAVGTVELPCTPGLGSVVEMNEDFKGYEVVLPVIHGLAPESAPSIHLPASLKPAAKTTARVVCTVFTNYSMFQEDDKTIVDKVVGISVENEVIRDLPEPVRIAFHHHVIQRGFSRRCVSWDTRKDPLKVNWLDEGCLTRQKGEQETECLCNHLTYFTVLVEMEPRPVRHLLALTAITSLGCAVSVISCVALIVFLCTKRRAKEQSVPIHLGLATSLLLLNLLFFLTGTLANLGGETLCVWVGASLHYALLSSFTWMGIEVFHTFWLVCMVFRLSQRPKAVTWTLIGFGFPLVPVVTLALVGGIYGVKEVVPSDDVSNPYLMCWMKNTHKALLAHYFTTMTILPVLVFSGLVMLFLVYRQIRSRDEWRQNKVAFLSIWGLSCLFGTTWGLGFLNFGPLSDFILFLSCILNSLQGFFLMLRFYMLGWVRGQAGGSSLGTSSTGSTRHHMLQHQEKN